MLAALPNLSADQANTAISFGCFVLTVVLYFASKRRYARRRCCSRRSCSCRACWCCSSC